jgi:hypothetical protein
VNYVFFVGNKRSGTSLFVRLLNAHPALFVAPEADLVWLLYQHERGEVPTGHPDDGDRGLNQTKKVFADLIANPTICARELGDRILLAWAAEQGKNLTALRCIGDKKPVQSTDPALVDFAARIWPDARFIHLVRHPYAAVASMRAAVAGPLHWMDIWRRPDGELLQFWTRNELRVLELKRRGFPVLTVKLADLTTCDPKSVIRRAFEFLEVAPDANLADAVRKIQPGVDEKYQACAFDMPPQAADLVELYEL